MLISYLLSFPLSGVLPVGVNTAAAAVSPGPSSTATAPTAATAERPATAVSHLSDKTTAHTAIHGTAGPG